MTSELVLKYSSITLIVIGVILIIFFFHLETPVLIRGKTKALNLTLSTAENLNIQTNSTHLTASNIKTISLRENGQIYDNTGYQMTVRAEKMDFEELEVSKNTELRFGVSPEGNTLSFINSQVKGNLFLNKPHHIQILDSDSMLLNTIRQPPTETLTFEASNFLYDRLINLCFNRHLRCKISNFEQANLDFNSDLNTAGYRNSLEHITVFNPQEHSYENVTSYTIRIARSEYIDISMDNNTLVFEMEGLANKVLINNSDHRDTIYVRFFKDSPLTQAITLLLVILNLFLQIRKDFSN